MAFLSYKEESRKNYGEKSSGDTLCKEQLTLGCLMRIADSLEKMEKPYQRLLDNYDSAQKGKIYFYEKSEKLKYSNRGLKGYITRLKNKG